MPVLIELSDIDNGQPFYFNAAHIYAVYRTDGGSRILDERGDFLDVKETPVQIDLKIDKQIRNVVGR